jgi:hypothetical protein
MININVKVAKFYDWLINQYAFNQALSDHLSSLLYIYYHYPSNIQIYQCNKYLNKICTIHDDITIY